MLEEAEGESRRRSGAAVYGGGGCARVPRRQEARRRLGRAVPSRPDVVVDLARSRRHAARRPLPVRRAEVAAGDVVGRGETATTVVVRTRRRVQRSPVVARAGFKRVRSMTRVHPQSVEPPVDTV